MNSSQRVRLYLRDRSELTPRQLRRAAHKMRRALYRGTE